MQATPTHTFEPADPEPRVRLEDLARHLAEIHTPVHKNSKPWIVITRHLRAYERTLQEAYEYFRAMSFNDPAFSRAGEWMLDNYYLVKRTFRQIEEDLPASFIGQLPKLDGTQLKGNPRIFAVTGEMIDFSQSELDLTQAAAFLQDYQQVTPLAIGELWALPTMLRIGILERLASASAELSDMEAPPHSGRDTRDLTESGSDPANPTQVDSVKLSNEIIVAHCFHSLRLLSATNWKDFFERTSRVEQILRKDPAGIYAGMDFETRNSYRLVVEELARYSTYSEEKVALAAIEFTRGSPGPSTGRGSPGPSTRREAHVGFYLRDAGRARLENSLHYRPGSRLRFQRALLAKPTVTYLGSTAILSVLFVLLILAYAIYSGGSLAQIILTGVISVGLALEAASTLVNVIVTHLIKPQSLPRMDFSEGIQPGNRTMVVVPTLLESAGELNHLLQELELYYLSNPDPQLTYALLTDFGDAPTEHKLEDEPLLGLARTGIETLNLKYSKSRPFYLFHRQRQWNPSEGVWMGWERKRGKLADFNRLLLNLGDTAYTTQVGNMAILRGSPGSSTGRGSPGSGTGRGSPGSGTETGIKYVITLDADTSLPQGSANRLVATLAHPLNRAEFSADGTCVIAGYTVLQPRVAIKPTSANRSLFSQIFSGNSGFDLYSFAVSDVYQDLFGEGSYVGKGIYDLSAFERSLKGQVRQNTLLSHDLFEGIYGRAALVTDIVLYEEYPARYLAYAQRLRRWIRGDWQLLPWLFPNVRTQDGIVPNRLSTINLWKVFDNLRRSLLPPTLLALLAAGWLFLPGSPLVWTLLVLLSSALPIGAQLIQEVTHNLGKTTLKKLIEPIRFPLMRWALAVLFLPYEALLTLSAIGTTLIRLLIARRHLLQWTTAANMARSFGLNPRYETWGAMAGSLFLTLILGIIIAIFNPPSLWVALPLLVAWLIAPQVAYRISQPVMHVSPPLPEGQRRQIRRLGRRTWAFFEQFAGPDDHWLPPDHYQESPLGSVAHYTTPTNIGLLLVAALSAHDMGYIGLSELAVRLRSTLESVSRLEHYRGHLLNWYDSQTLAALPPHYVSTVDSGNLAACLIALKQGCLTMKDTTVLGEKQWQGLLVILDILLETLSSLEKDQPADVDPISVGGASIKSIEGELTNIYERILTIQSQPERWKEILAWLSGEGWENVSYHLMELLERHPNLKVESLGELQLYLNLMHHHLIDMRLSLDSFAPWLAALDSPPAPFKETPGWDDLFNSLPAKPPTLGQAGPLYKQIQKALMLFKAQLKDEKPLAWCQQLYDGLSSAGIAVERLLNDFQEVGESANAAVTGMDFRFLFDDRRQLFHIGYNASTEQLDPNYYDLLASEARIASLVAIAKGDVPQSHWQHLGRPVTQVNGKQILLSWGGTTFEYLMPTLFTRNYRGTFLSDSCYAALDAQKNYGQEQHVPWGISESGFFAFDASLNYQYRAFGVPSLGYKRDLADDLVIAPYASLLGLSLQPQALLENMAHLQQLQILGRFGFYEALDYTKSRLPIGQSHGIVKSYMAHHQGMILLAICNYLSNDVMVERFHADERIHSIELLLQEKIPQNPPIEYPHPDDPDDLPQGIRSVHSAPWRVPVESSIPQVHVLSRGEMSVLITNAGAGYSQWRDFALTRWQADTTLDQWGTWIYIQDRESGKLWSATCQPIGSALENQEVWFYPHKVEFQRSDNGISLHTGITVGTDGVEIRRVNILNESDRNRRLKLTSYGEVVLAAQAADQRHPAFNKLFIESEYLPQENALLFQRRSRSSEEKPIVLIHAILIEVGRKVTGDHESDRARFLGRSQTPRTPVTLQEVNQPTSSTSGGTLDPIFSLGQEIDLKPHAKTRVTFLTLAAPSRHEALEKLSHYQAGIDIYHAFEEANAIGEEELVDLGLTANSVENIQRILSALVYPVGTLRAAPHILAQNNKGQSALWGYGISGDYPILLAHVRDGKSSLLIEALQAFIYWHNRQVNVNLVVLNEQDTGYSLELHNAIHDQIRRTGADDWLNQQGEGIFVLRTDQLQQSDQLLLETVAGVVLDESNGSLAEHAQQLITQPTPLPGFTSILIPANDPEPTPPLILPNDLLKFNGVGGFSRDGREYVIQLQPGQHTPHPWINVIANPHFGFMVSEAGSGCTWAENSGENRLTPWNNDPVTDMPGEALYLRDEETGLVWSPTPMPAGAETVHRVSHGAGYSVFESQSHGLNQKLRVFADPSAPVKIAHLRLQNLWKRPRRVTVTYYAEWVLGTTRNANQAHIIPEFAPDQHALLAANHFNTEFGQRVAFLAASKKPHGVTTDRTEFLGRMGSLQIPAALKRIGLASALNAGLDPCAAIQLHVDLAPGATEEVFS